MPGKDLTRWQENDDGSWSRIPLEDQGDDRIDATSGALEAADELGVDLATVTGTGAGGRITKADVEAAATE